MKKQLIILSFIISLTATAQIPNYVPTNGLVGWWPFNGNANDESGNGNNGTVNGATLTTDRFGVANKAYSFDGVNDFISLSTLNQLGLTSSSFTISIWTNCSVFGANGDEDYIIGTPMWGGGSDEGVKIQNNSVGNVNGIFSSSLGIGGQIYASTSNSFSLNTWYMLTVRYNNINGLFEMFVNGTYYSGNNLIGTPLANPYPISVGAFVGPWLGGFLTGKTDDIGIWNRALTQQEITNLYNSQTLPACSVTATNNTICAGSSTTLTASSSATNVSACASSALPSNLQTGLVGYWPFCGNVNDASGNGNNGTVNGATLTTDRFGNANSAYNFDGNDWIGVSHNQLFNLPGNGDFSFSAWIQSSNAFTEEAIISKGHGSGQNQPDVYIFSKIGSQIGLELASIPNAFWNYSSNTISVNNWNSVVAVYNSVNNQVKFYINGVLGAVSSYPFLPTSNNDLNQLFFGKQGYGCNCNFFSGKIDDIAMYNRALTATEIQQLYNQGQTTYSWSNGATTPSITVSPTQTTTYTCTVTTNGTSCSSDFTVTVNPLPPVNAGNDQTVCAGTAVTLSGTGANTYSWNNSVSNGVAFTPVSTATYTVTGTNTATGCTNTDQVVVNVNALPAVNAGNDQTVCAGTAVTLSGTGANTYSWNNSVSNGIAFTPVSTATYTVTGTNTATGCTNTDQVVVNVNPLPTVNAGNDQTVCAGTAVTLSGNGANTYSWNNSVSNGVAFTPASTVTYTVTGTDANNCSSTDQVTVTVNALPSVSAGPDQELCQGQSTTLFGSGADTYSWSNNVTNGVGFLPTNTQSYVVSGTNSANGCVNFDTVTVIVNSLPTVSAGMDQTICKGDSLSLTGSGALSYQWNNNVTDGVFFAPQTTQTYSVTGTDANGCVGTDAVTVNVNDLSFSTLNESALDSYTLNGQTYTQSGTYTQVLTNAAGCDSTITLNLTLSYTGINESEDVSTFRIYPNPTRDVVFIEFAEERTDDYVLMDASGRKVQMGTLNGKTTSISLKDLSTGTYMLQIGADRVPIRLVKE